MKLINFRILTCGYGNEIAAPKKNAAFNYLLILTVLAFVSFNTTGCVDQFLLAGKKRMAIRTDFYRYVFHGRSGLDNITASTGYLGHVIFRVYFLFHISSKTLI
jgi:hypothetical protein